MDRFAEIILPLSLSQTLTYAIPPDMQGSIAGGMRVIVPVGKSKFYTGIVLGTHNNDPRYPDIKPITAIIDERPTLTRHQLALWQFIADYYCSSLGEVYRTALPSALRIESENEINLVSDMLLPDTRLTPKEKDIVETLSDRKTHLTSEFESRHLTAIRRLIERGIVTNNERLVDAYKPRYETYIALAGQYRSPQAVEALAGELKRAKKQLETLDAFLTASPDFAPIERSCLTKNNGIGAAAIKALADRGVFTVTQRQIDRIDTLSEATTPLNPLSQAQANALTDIKANWNNHRVVLLHGAAASGKTEIYIHLIQEVIAGGGQALLLLPEVGLTRRLTQRLKQYFGSAMGIYHSQCSNYERVETYNHQLSDTPYGLIVGVRSAVFLPFQNLKLIVVDDEHDTGYKQADPAPRFHGRDTAVYLAAICGAKVLLGTSTPSVDSYANCHFKKYGLVRLNTRYCPSATAGNAASQPAILLTDIQECRRQRRLKGHFSFEMIAAIRETIAAHRQVIVFQNRRGFAPYTECTQCGYVPRCPNCDVSLTVHKHTGALTCHYCGHTEPWQTVCPQCRQPTLTTRGFGTEQVEAELRLLFPEANIGRLDLDTSRTTAAYDRIFGDLESGATDILVGTQMVTKGIDLENVALVCIVNADNLLYHADFRAHERAFHILGQAIGRCGRGNTAGKVMIQTSQPDNPVIKQIVADDYEAFFAGQMLERHAFSYPPYYRLIRITVKHTDKNTCHIAAHRFAERLRLRFANRVLGPDAPAISRIQNRYIQQIMLKIETQAPVDKAKRILADEIAAMKEAKDLRQATYAIDVDPQ